MDNLSKINQEIARASGLGIMPNSKKFTQPLKRQRRKIIFLIQQISLLLKQKIYLKLFLIGSDEVAEGEEEEGEKKNQNADDHLSSNDREILLNAFLDDTSSEYEFTGHVTTKDELINLFKKIEKVHAESLDPSNSDNQEFISIYDKVKATILKWKDKFDSARKTIKTAQKNQTLMEQIKKIEAYESKHLPNYTINDKMKKPHTVAEATRAIAELNQTLPLLQRDLARKQAILDRLKAL